MQMLVGMLAIFGWLWLVMIVGYCVYQSRKSRKHKS